MSYTELVFSPTGGTRKAADELVRAWGASADVVDLSEAGRDFGAMAFRAQDVVILAAPVFGGMVPNAVLDRIAQVRGGGARCVALCVYGNRAYDNALAQLRDVAVSCGFTVVAAIAAVAEHSIVRKYAAGRPDADDLKALRGFARQISPLLAADRPVGELAVPGKGARVEQRQAGMVPKPTKACAQCGACAAGCPVGAIDADLPNVVAEKTCLGCMRCVVRCPARARKTGAVMTKLVEFALAKPCSTRKEPQLFLVAEAKAAAQE